MFSDLALNLCQPRVANYPLSYLRDEDLSMSFESVAVHEQIDEDTDTTTFRGSFSHKDVTIKVYDYPVEVEDQLRALLDLSCLKTFQNNNLSRFIGSGMCSVIGKPKVTHDI